MLDKELVLTPAGMVRLQQELEHLITVQRVAIADDIRHSRQPGDLDESSEYAEAKTAQAVVEQRIAELRKVLGTARLLQSVDLCCDTTGLGSMVRVRDLESEEEWEFTLVSSPETDPERDLISVDCPLGGALFGRRPGETVMVETPAGRSCYQILSLRPVEL